MPTLRFQIFGFPVRVEPSYWFMTALIGFSLSQSSLSMALVAIGVIFVSILVHELGHAFAARSFGIHSQISLHMMGGTTAFPPDVRLSRARDIIISLAGPFSGFLVGAFTFVLYRMYAPASTAEAIPPSLFVIALAYLAEVNLIWGAINLIPVTPLDGSRVLAALLGPTRKNVVATVSLVVGLSAAFFFLQNGNVIAAMFFALFAVSGFFRARQDAAGTAGVGVPASEINTDALVQALRAAEQALQSGAHAQAAALAKGVLKVAQTRELVSRALNISLWASLGTGDTEGAYALLQSFPAHTADPYAAGATLEAKGELEAAHQVLDQARGHGDRRLELMGLLIQVLLKQKNYAAAAETTREIVDKIAPEDARRVATEVEQAGSDVAAAELHLAVAKTQRSFRDACSAVFAFARAGSRDGVLAAYKVAKSFDGEGSRKLLNDERLGEVRSLLEST